ncbi:hypothetical protein U472_03240 [Orenia metallireducens]|uniref:Uncharacterized protein n=1 Tax=Orenia metallireducens TaxID=1413210 RepID=A0A1C0AB29_9FIRM|nr:hypothetical protein [Orenia metallireducens]OCL27582.1 hypothetical protein U472_03240 [Orenia metallireducens]
MKLKTHEDISSFLEDLAEQIKSKKIDVKTGEILKDIAKAGTYNLKVKSEYEYKEKELEAYKEQTKTMQELKELLGQ